MISTSWGEGGLNARVQLLHPPTAIKKQAQTSSTQWRGLCPPTQNTCICEQVEPRASRAATPSLHQPVLMCDCHIKPVSFEWLHGNSRA